jgi:hypothetical protein
MGPMSDVRTQYILIIATAPIHFHRGIVHLAHLKLPTVGELRAIMREGKSQIDLKVAHELKIAARVKKARPRPETCPSIPNKLKSLMVVPPTARHRCLKLD